MKLQPIHEIQFTALTPQRGWPQERIKSVESQVEEAFNGAERWLRDQLQRIDQEITLEST